MTDLLHAQHVTKRFGGLIAVSSVDFTIPENAIVSLIGPNGAGKTTFFNIIAGIYDPSGGEIAFSGRRMIARTRRSWLEPVLWVLPGALVALFTIVLGSSTASTTSVIIGIALTVFALMIAMLIGVSRPPWYQRSLVRLGIFKSARPNDMVQAGLGRTFQNIRLFQNMTALENVLVGMHTRLKATWLDAMFSTPRDRREEKEAAEEARGFLRLVGLRGKDGELAKNLPYGDQRRLEIARALGSKPKLLLLDEPASGLNHEEVGAIGALIRSLRERLKLTVLVVEHHMQLLMSLSDWVVALNFGKRIAEGPPAEVRNHPELVRAYLGAPA